MIRKKKIKNWLLQVQHCHYFLPLPQSPYWIPDFAVIAAFFHHWYEGNCRVDGLNTLQYARVWLSLWWLPTSMREEERKCELEEKWLDGCWFGEEWRESDEKREATLIRVGDNFAEAKGDGSASDKRKGIPIEVWRYSRRRWKSREVCKRRIRYIGKEKGKILSKKSII